VDRRPIFNKRKNPIGIVILFIIIVAVAVMGVMYSGNNFEKIKPKVTYDTNGYWNLKTNIKVDISDNLGIKYYKISMIDGAKTTIIDTKILETPVQKITINIKPPKLNMFSQKNSKNIKLITEVIDSSKWNFLEGNKAVVDTDILIDTKKPVANIVTNSYAIRRGGSAVAIVEVHDDNLKDAYIEFSKTTRFELTPFYKEGYFIALIAWPVDIEEFKRVHLIAIDKAGNKKRIKIPYYIRKLKIKEDKIKVSDKFIDRVSTKVLEKSQKTYSDIIVPDELEDIFIYSNSILRAKNVAKLREIGLSAVPQNMIKSFKINRFRRLKGSRTFAGFAEYRSYYYEDKKINEAWHLGMDWASIKNAPIRISNSGVVVYNDYNGIYGNTIVLDHGLGLCSLYAHTSSSTVDVGDYIKRGKIIAQTGSTGAVFGDHLHFGILVQGIEVNPKEWMDYNWIKTRILNTIKDGKKLIDSNH
jgi:hypothetical protein